MYQSYPQRHIGVSFVNLNCYGTANTSKYQATFTSYAFRLVGSLGKLLWLRQVERIKILNEFTGLIRAGDMLLVLGRPGSGCSTLLKTLAGNTDGLTLEPEASIIYQGTRFRLGHRAYREDSLYLAELDVHLPELTVKQTLEFAASTRKQDQGSYLTRASNVAAQFELHEALDTQIGNAMIRGVSGGEKRRTSIAEAFLGGAQFQCWDNSTRGLDSGTAYRFIQMLRESTVEQQSTVALTLYQASEAIYQSFDKVTLLYEGHQIYFGPVELATDYFISLGFVKHNRATTADFLTSITNPSERVVRKGFEEQAPTSPAEFANAWKQSDLARLLVAEIEEFNSRGIGDPVTENENLGKDASMFTLPIYLQAFICTLRAVRKIQMNPAPTVGNVIANVVLGVIIGSAYYNLGDDTDSLQQRATLIFFALIVNSFLPAYEISLIWASRPVVEKHSQYAFYHPFTDAIASMLTELPTKIAVSIGFHLPIYFLANLRRTPSAFFIHLLFMFFNLLTMSVVFRTFGSLSRTLVQAIPPTAVLSLLCSIYNGFIVPPAYMKPWLAWFWRINPVAYTYESLMINELGHRLFPCSTLVPAGPPYHQVDDSGRSCSVVGSVAGQNTVQGTNYLLLKYGYLTNHLWRNLGIIIALMVFFCTTHLVATEFIPSQRPRGEVLLFKARTRRDRSPALDEELGVFGSSTQPSEDKNTSNVKGSSPLMENPRIPNLHHHGAVFHWKSVNYTINLRNGPRQILNNVDGWVKPGTLTALMGVTGAGKTALLDTLADRITNGTITGDIYVDGKPRDQSFRRRMGYAQQEDIHLHTASVREALQFSALLRQPRSRSKAEKLSIVEDVIHMMEMGHYADAIVGVPGEGLNIEQRKRLTIAIEMAATPDVLLFLDEPTSGLDSQTAWSICTLLRKLADEGQAILCTIHQPSSQLFAMFDRVLLLGTGGNTLYFGDIGPEASSVIGYFEEHGAPKCKNGENPAEWLLDVTQDTSSANSPQPPNEKDWPQMWQWSSQKQEIFIGIESPEGQAFGIDSAPSSQGHEEFATSLPTQLYHVTHRIFAEQWRDPIYLYSKICLCISLALVNGISFYNNSQDIQGVTSLLFSCFLITQLFSCINQLVIPRFVEGRKLFEARERQSKSYRWSVLISANLIVELAWQTIISVPVFASWYYPIGLYRDSSGTYSTAERGAISFVIIWFFNLWANTLSQSFAAGIQHAETVVQVATLCFWLSLVFCGVLIPPTTLPRFWIFLYRASPLTYFIEGLASAVLSNTAVRCSDIEMLQINLPANSEYHNCGQYLAAYSMGTGGYVANPDDSFECLYCPVGNANIVLESFGAVIGRPWTDAGILGAYVIFNIVAMYGIYWLVRVPRKPRTRYTK